MSQTPRRLSIYEREGKKTCLQRNSGNAELAA